MEEYRAEINSLLTYAAYVSKSDNIRVMPQSSLYFLKTIPFLNCTLFIIIVVQCGSYFFDIAVRLHVHGMGFQLMPFALAK